jgi:hypothetical protein
MSVAPGIYVGAVGAPTGVQLQGGTQVRIGRSYTHLKPIKSIRRALKEPYRNLLVGLVKKETGEVFDELLSPEFEGLDDPKKAERLKALLTAFNETMATGDSFVISDNISGDAYVGAAYSFTERLKVQASLYASQISLRRLHIVKMSDTMIQVFKARGDAGIKGIQVSIEALVPIITFTSSKMKGTAETEFFTLDIDPQTQDNLQLTTNLLALRSLFKEGSLELLRRQAQPFHIGHRFREKITDTDFLFMDYSSAFNHDAITVTHPQGGERSFLRQTMGVLKGEDYQGLTIDAINAWFEDSLDFSLEVPNPSSGDPGDTFKGNSHLRNAVLEFAVPDSSIGVEAETFFKVDYKWKGWKINRGDMRELLSDVNEKFGTELFSDIEFRNARNYQLYAVDVSVYVYETAIQHLLTLTDRELKHFLEENAVWPESRPRAGETPLGFKSRMEETVEKRIRWALKFRKEFHGRFQNPNRDSMTAGLKFLSSIETLLEFEDFAKLIGGDQNYLVFGQVRAFREGDENGDLPVMANTMGQFGSDKVRGPLAEIQSLIGINESEMFLRWFLGGF